MKAPIKLGVAAWVVAGSAATQPLVPILGSSPAMAQIDCPPGYEPVPISGGWTCGGAPYEPPPPKETPPGMIIPYDPERAGRWWGSVVEGKEGWLFHSYGQRSSKEAEHESMGLCQTNPNTADGPCRILKTSKITRIAVAWDGSRHYVGTGDGAFDNIWSKSTKKAMDACRKGPASAQCQISLRLSPVGGAIQ